MKALLWLKDNILLVVGWTVFAFLIILSVGCTTHGQHFTEYHPNGQVKYEMDIRHYTAFMSAEAAKLQTETQMEEFLFNVYVDDLKKTVDTTTLSNLLQIIKEVKTP